MHSLRILFLAIKNFEFLQKNFNPLYSRAFRPSRRLWSVLICNRIHIILAILEFVVTQLLNGALLTLVDTRVHIRIPPAAQLVRDIIRYRLKVNGPLQVKSQVQTRPLHT